MSALPTIEEFREMRRNTLLGFARVRLPSGLILHDVAVHQKEGRAWASPPGRPALGKDGTQLQRDGKAVFNPTVTFANRALRASNPGVV